MSDNDNEAAQLQAWVELRTAAIEDTKDARIAELERIVDQQRGQFEALRGSFVTVNKRNNLRFEYYRQRVKQLENALHCFATVTTESDEIYYAADDYELHTYMHDDIGRGLTVRHLRDAFKALYDRECPTGHVESEETHE